MISKTARDILALRELKGVGKKTINKFLIQLTDQDQLLMLFRSLFKDKFSISDSDIEHALKKADAQLNIAHEKEHSVITYLDENYPESLKNTQDFPAVLFAHGDLSLLSSDCVTVIGTRSPTDHGAVIAERVTKWLVGASFTIVSGLAKGVDSISHRSTLNNKGKTIAIVAHGLEKIYPAENKVLAADIVQQGGLIITEYCYNSYVGKSNFVERDKIQAALAKAVFLIQSSETGGSMHASRAALTYGRYLVAVGQSKTDSKNKEANIYVNEVLLGGDLNEIVRIMKVDSVLCKNILPLRSTSDQSVVEGEIRRLSYGEETKQHLIG
jgi:DNA processing protein